MYQFYHKISKINDKVNTIFISHVTLTTYFDEALNKRSAARGSSFCVWLVSCNDSMSLVVRKWLSIDLDRKSNVFGDVNVGEKNQNFNIPLILDKYNIMI